MVRVEWSPRADTARGEGVPTVLPSSWLLLLSCSHVGEHTQNSIADLVSLGKSNISITANIRSFNITGVEIDYVLVEFV